MRLDFSYILNTDPLPTLLHNAPVAIRYHTLFRLLELPADTKVIQGAREELLESDEIQRLVHQQNSDGLWPPATKFTQESHQVGAQFLSQVQHLHQLRDLGAVREDPFVQKGIVALMKMQLGDGKFPLFYQHQGYVLWVLLQYGMQGNPFVELGLRWLMKRQRKDGGWLHTVQVPRGKKMENVASCIWTTLHSVWPMSLHSRYSRDAHVHKGVQYVLDHFLEKNHTKFLNSPDDWNFLYVGHDDLSAFRGGTLKVLEVASKTGFTLEHPVVKKAARWLREQQLDNGLFPAIAGKDREGDPMVTLRTLSVLKTLYAEKVVTEE